MKTAEEFLTEKIGKLQNTEIDINDYVLAEWLEEYASQRVADIVTANIALNLIDNPEEITKAIKDRLAKFQDYKPASQSLLEITDEEIEKEMNNRGLIIAWDRMNGRTMAKWYRSELKKRMGGKKDE